MKIEETSYSELLDLYKGLLTPLKGEIAEMYFSCDLSLSEIAEIKNCTRQSVLDAIKTVKSELDAFERAVGFLAYKRETDKIIDKISKDEKEKLKGISEE